MTVIERITVRACGGAVSDGIIPVGPTAVSYNAAPGRYWNDIAVKQAAVRFEGFVVAFVVRGLAMIYGWSLPDLLPFSAGGASRQFLI